MVEPALPRPGSRASRASRASSARQSHSSRSPSRAGADPLPQPVRSVPTRSSPRKDRSRSRSPGRGTSRDVYHVSADPGMISGKRQYAKSGVRLTHDAPGGRPTREELSRPPILATAPELDRERRQKDVLIGALSKRMYEREEHELASREERSTTSSERLEARRSRSRLNENSVGYNLFTGSYADNDRGKELRRRDQGVMERMGRRGMQLYSKANTFDPIRGVTPEPASPFKSLAATTADAK